MSSINPNHDKNLWIAGDFNLPHIDWKNMCVTPGNSQATQSDLLLEYALDQALTQLVTEPTRKENILDLVFTTSPSLVNRIGTTPPLGEGDHNIVFVDVNTKAATTKKTSGVQQLFHKADWNSMEKELQDFQLPEGPTQQLWDSLANKLESLIASNVPTCRARKHNQKPWVTPELVTLFHMRDRAFQRSKSSKATSSRNAFLQLRQEAQQEERKAYKQYTESIFNLRKDECNPTERHNVCKRFWSFIKSRRMDSCGIPALKSEGTLISNAQGKAKILNKQYTSVFNKKDSDLAPTKGPSPDIQIREDGVLKMLKGLNPNKACGPDKLPQTLVKNLAGVLAKPLTAIFQSSIDQGCVPEQWKKALVSPIYKKGDRHTAAN